MIQRHNLSNDYQNKLDYDESISRLADLLIPNDHRLTLSIEDSRLIQRHKNNYRFDLNLEWEYFQMWLIS